MDCTTESLFSSTLWILSQAIVVPRSLSNPCVIYTVPQLTMSLWTILREGFDTPQHGLRSRHSQHALVPAGVAIEAIWLTWQLTEVPKKHRVPCIGSTHGILYGV